MPAGKLIRWVFTFLGEGSTKYSLNETQDEQQQQKGTIMNNRIFEEFLLDCRMSTKMLDSSHVHSVLRQWEHMYGWAHVCVRACDNNNNAAFNLIN